ncbi:MAG: polymer-forming cytoskeletal protein [Chloroflexi bacterium]|nr:polymer-forming cytoskeletal protein [Chloroflexota bacterium]
MSGLFGKREAGMASLAEGKIETVIGISTTLIGSIRTEGNVRIDGLMEGDLDTAGSLVVSRTGRLSGNVRAKDVIVAGAIKGDIDAVGRVELASTSKVWGNVVSDTLLIDEGAVFRGESAMREEYALESLDFSPTRREPAPEA